MPQHLSETHDLAFIWTRDQPWRNLTHELSTETTTVVSFNGTSRVLCPTGEWQTRVPLLGAHTMYGDLQRMPLSEITFASPCGVLAIGSSSDDWHVTTPILAVLHGENPEWASSPVGQRYVADLRALPHPDEHPARRCPVTYCNFKGSDTAQP